MSLQHATEVRQVFDRDVPAQARSAARASGARDSSDQRQNNGEGIGSR